MRVQFNRVVVLLAVVTLLPAIAVAELLRRGSGRAPRHTGRPRRVPACPVPAAAELYRNPLLAAAMRAVGTVPIARRDPTLARRQLAELAPGGAFAVRPGTVEVVLLRPIHPSSTGGDHRALRTHVERAVLDALGRSDRSGLRRW